MRLHPVLARVTVSSAVVGLALAASIGTAGAGQAAQPADNRQIRIERSLHLHFASTEPGGWSGWVRMGRFGQIDGERQVWRPGPLGVSVSRVQCDLAGCLTISVSTADDSSVILPMRIAPGLSEASARPRLVPVVVERRDGTRVISRQHSVVVFSVLAQGAGPISTESGIWTDRQVRRDSSLRWIAASGTLSMSMMPISTGAGALAGPEVVDVTGGQGRIAVRRTTITTVAKD